MDRLPRGRHGLSREFVARNQRERLITALTEALYEVGYQKITVSLIGQRAAVSKSDFYKRFETKDDCFVAAYEAAIERIQACVLKACEGGADGEWSLRVRDALAALLALLASDPALASISLVAGLRAGRDVNDRFQKAMDGFASLLRTGAPAGAGGQAVDGETDEAVVGGIASLLGRRVLAGEAEQLEELLPGLLEFALTPYVGTAKARRVISAG